MPRTTVRAASALVAIALAALLPSVASGATGDPAAIALFRTAAHTTNALPSYVIAQTGYVRIHDSLGRTRSAHWAWGWDQFRRGFHEARERIVLVQHGGSTEWIEDLMTPVARSCSAATCGGLFPIELLITPTRAFDGIVSSGSTATCFEPVARSRVPYVAGVPWWSVVGDLSAARVVGASTQVTARFVAGAQHVAEADWIRTASRRFTRSSVHVAAGGGRPAFSYASTDTPLRSLPRAPKLTLCS